MPVYDNFDKFYIDQMIQFYYPFAKVRHETRCGSRLPHTTLELRMKARFVLLSALGVLSLLAAPLSSARTVGWSNEAFDPLYDSSGNALDSSFRFEVGAFVTGFMPTASNMADWAANWRVFDLAFHDTAAANPADGGWNVAFSFFAGSANHLTNGTSDSIYASAGHSFAQNTQAYLWVYNSKDFAFTSEWALVADLSATGNTADRWLFPNPADQISPSLIWALSDADTAIIGGLNSGAVQGTGNYTSQPSSYALQTYQVPEPGGALLIGSAGLLLMLRRRRLATA